MIGAGKRADQDRPPNFVGQPFVEGLAIGLRVRMIPSTVIGRHCPFADGVIDWLLGNPNVFLDDRIHVEAEIDRIDGLRGRFERG